MNLFTAALAENAVQPIEKAIPAEAAGSIMLFGMSMGVMMVMMSIWFILQVIADWKIFEKAGEPGWKSIIPVYNTFVEYDICWSGLYGLLFTAATVIASLIPSGADVPTWYSVVVIALGVVACVLHFIQSLKLSKAFGEGTGFGILLFFFGPICRIILGFGGSRYIGKR